MASMEVGSSCCVKVDGMQRMKVDKHPGWACLCAKRQARGQEARCSCGEACKFADKKHVAPAKKPGKLAVKPT